MENPLPLFIVTGASGSGKTYVVNDLRQIMPDYEVFDTDSLIEVMGHDWEKIRMTWLRIAREIARNGRMTILCGTQMPWDIEKCADYPAFRHVYYLNLHCKEEAREKRLRERNWTDEMIRNHLDFANALLEIAAKEFDPPMPTIDTTELDASAVASRIKDWVLRHA
ncbi:nucleoside kinase [Cohnella sp. AR92]|uniref:nucleoside kinase n=1 Tax=Cohnella sp. AR92 TaxID=648716 RepID=UPI001EE0789A|nr:nucleoside kinase [Cohnella sp. AR92]